MNKTRYIELYLFILECCSDELVIAYVKKRNEVITCGQTGWTYIDKHLKETLEHRKLIYYAFLLIGESLTARDREKVHQLVLRHDLSKFSAVEIIGYSLKFSKKEGKELKKNFRYSSVGISAATSLRQQCASSTTPSRWENVNYFFN